MFVAGAFPRSSVPAHSAERKDRYRAADHPDQDASAALPLHHSTPRLTISVTTMNTTMDNSTVAANFESIPNSLAAYASVMRPTLSDAERSLR
jgi:hypothetical protein